MENKLQIKGLWVPLLTPFKNGELDKDSLLNLIKATEEYIDGFVPCLSSGEGSKVSNELWSEVVEFVTKNTTKPVASGILRDNLDEILTLAKTAKSYGCIAIVVAIKGKTPEEQKEFCKELEESALPVIVYNTETININDIETLVDISKNKNIIAIKDSSQNQQFFDEVVHAKKEGKINISILQGMENQLLQSAKGDGYLIALANAEPQLCRDMLQNPSNELNQQIMEKWDEYDLASPTWYLNLKNHLFKVGIIKSPEQV